MVDAIADQTNGAVAVLPATPAGLLTAEQLKKIAEITENGAGLAKLTSMQRIAILVKKEQVEQVKESLKEVGLKVGVVGKREVWNPMGCTGSLCKFAKQDALTDAIAISELVGMNAPRQVKIGVSGCQNSCAWSKVVDVGLIGNKDGYEIFIGGDAGKNPHVGQKLKNVPKEDLVNTVKEIVSKFNTHGNDGEHIYDVIERCGLEVFR